MGRISSIAVFKGPVVSRVCYTESAGFKVCVTYRVRGSEVCYVQSAGFWSEPCTECSVNECIMYRVQEYNTCRVQGCTVYKVQGLGVHYATPTKLPCISTLSYLAWL